MSMQIARASDARRVREIGVRSYRDHFAALWSAGELDAWLDEEFAVASVAADIEYERATYVLWHEHPEDVGYAKLRWSRPAPVGGERGAELQKIYFLAGSTRHGRGTRLIEACLGLARDRGEPQVWLEVLDDNVRAQALYERTGFARVGEHEVERGGRRWRRVVMQHPFTISG
ncbi:MAG TPA: GNAT family N-acetyltransferase [Rudaea sp.]|nr:GNAT family N-acetyltransferase [Rudaea sp.]